MTADLGPGDVVESLFDMPTLGVGKGARGTVTEVGVGNGICLDCRKRTAGFWLAEYPITDPRFVAWCRCGWRKVGGSQADTARLFAEDLDISDWAKKVAEPLPVDSFRRIA